MGIIAFIAGAELWGTPWFIPGFVILFVGLFIIGVIDAWIESI